MTQRHLIYSLVALAATAICIVLGFTRISGTVGTGTWTAYPAAFFGIVAVVELYKWLSFLWKPRPNQDA